jgi:hypothetical protein
VQGSLVTALPINSEGEVVPDGATLRVPMPFMDALSNRTARAFADENRPLVLDVPWSVAITPTSSCSQTA